MSDATSRHNEAALPMSKQEEILRAANVLFEPGQLVEVRLKGRDRRIAPRYYKDHENMAAVLAKEDASERWTAAWWTLQKLKAEAHAGKQAPETTKRADIEVYRWLVIDVDRADEQSKKLNATLAEKEQLLAVARTVMSWQAGTTMTPRFRLLQDAGLIVVAHKTPCPATGNATQWLRLT